MDPTPLRARARTASLDELEGSTAREPSFASPRSQLAGDCEPSGEEPKGSRCRRFFARKRNWALLAVVLGALSVGGYFAVASVAKGIIASRVAAAPVDVLAVHLELKPAAQGPMRPTMLVHAPASVLTLPLLSFTATVTTREAVVSIEKSGAMAPVGTFAPDPIELESGKALDVEVTGAMVLNLEHASDFQAFMTNKRATVSVDAAFSVSAKVWGFFPFGLSGVHISRAVTVNGLDMHGSNQDLNMSAITSVQGFGNTLRIGAAAGFFNPSVVHLQMRGPIRVDVLYETASLDWAPIGMVILGDGENITILPGMNEMQATFYLTPTVGNGGAIRSAITDFLGTPKGFGKSGLVPLRLRCVAPPDSPLGAGLMPARPYDPRVSAVLRGLDLPITFRPISMLFLTAATLDVHLASLSHKRYDLSVGVYIPVPKTVQLQAISCSAYYPDINGELVYSFDHPLPEPITLPGLTNSTAHVSLQLSEITIPSFANIEKIAKEVLLDGKSHVGVLVRLTLAVDDFVQDYNYRNDRIPAIINLHPF